MNNQIIPVRGFTPTLGKNCFIAPGAYIIGNVTLGDDCTIWFNAVVRGDVSRITTGNRCNIQDGVVIHGTYQKTDTLLGNNVSIAHNAIVHGCTIEDNVLIGMGAIIMDGTLVKSGSIIAAGAIVPANTIIEENSIWAGNPAKFLKKTGDKLAEIERIAGNYPFYASWFEHLHKP